MKNQVHILNGDSLNKIFPATIAGQRIIMRECLVQGPVNAENFDIFYANRKHFIETAYNLKDIDYKTDVVQELEKLKNIGANCELNLWFEEDVICQLNCWFLIYFIWVHTLNVKVFLVLPTKKGRYAFSNLNCTTLEQMFFKRTPISSIGDWAQLWEHLQKHDFDKLLKIGEKYKKDFPFVLLAIQNYINALPNQKKESVLLAGLKSIMKENTKFGFNEVFNAFQEKFEAYGYGDLQVKYLLQQLNQTKDI